MVVHACGVLRLQPCIRLLAALPWALLASGLRLYFKCGHWPHHLLHFRRAFLQSRFSLLVLLLAFSLLHSGHGIFSDSSSAASHGYQPSCEADAAGAFLLAAQTQSD
jgi:hypothetical protein